VSSSGPRIEIVAVEGDSPPERLAAVRELFAEYAGGLGVDLCFQNFEQELAGLPGDYAPPLGALLLALVDGVPAGCGALRALPDVDYTNACEMKRLFVRSAFRGFGLGRSLAQALMEQATRAGYSTLLLDTLDDMESARGLYETLGFVEVPPYYFNPIPGAHYLKAELDSPGTRW
jgi:putative acetyltransferase